MDNFEPLTPEEKAGAGTQKKKSDKDEGVVIFPMPEGVAINATHPTLGKPSLVWDYRDALGQLIFCVCRFFPAAGEKEDRPLTYRQFKDGAKRMCWKSVDVPRPLYGLDRLAAHPDAPVLVCEGEKATDAAQKLFPAYVAVTSPNGAGSAHCADWEPLQGRTIIIWPDHDKEGKDYAEAVARLIIQTDEGN